MHCQINGSPGWKWGSSGKCYPGPQGREKAARQGRAIQSSRFRSDAIPFIFSSQDFKIELIRQRREMLKQAGGRLPSSNKIPARPASGKTLEISYFASINRLVSPIKTIIKEILLPRLPNIIATFKREMKVDSYSDLITEAFDNVDIAFAGKFNESDVGNVTESMAKRTSNFNARQVDRQFISVLGVAPMRSEPYLIPQIDAFVTRNVSLIKTIPSEYFDKLEILIRTRIEEGVSTTALKKEIFESFGKITTRSALIARDQINKFQGALSQLRQTEVGVTHYRWLTARDERVRTSHRDLDGKKQSWKKPPVSGTGGEKLHPGFPINCRCVAQPILDDFIKQPSRRSSFLAGSVLR